MTALPQFLHWRGTNDLCKGIKGIGYPTLQYIAFTKADRLITVGMDLTIQSGYLLRTPKHFCWCTLLSSC